MVCVNSTSGTLALAAGKPVCTLGEAIYNVPGLTYDGHLDDFWADPEPPAPGLYEAFRKVLVNRCLVRGGLASESAVSTLVESMTERMCGDPVSETIVEKAPAEPRKTLRRSRPQPARARTQRPARRVER